MDFLYQLEKIRVPVLNELMLGITTLGEETAFLVIALIVFWCMDKRRGYLLMAVGFMGTIFNQYLKLTFRVPRPWVLDPNFTILDQAREAATGYSFPSGHTTMAVGTFGALAATEKRKWLLAIFVAVAALVGFSRMYVGVHTPADVLVGALTSVLLIVAFKPVLYSESKALIYALFGFMIVMALAFFAYVELYTFPVDIDSHNLSSGVKNAYTMLGCVTGAVVVYFVEARFVCFDEKALWWVQLIKIVGGILAVLAVKEGMRFPLEWIFGGHMAARAVRYFLIVLVAGIFWPMTFKFWNTLAEKRKKNG